VYGQQEVVKDLIAARLDAGLPLLFEASVSAVEGVESERPRVRFRHEGAEHELECDVVAGCDGFHGVCRDAIPAGVLSAFEREYPFGWLGVLARVEPASEELIYAWNERGFALHSMRTPEISRLYLQVRHDEDLGGWPEDRIWSELQLRLGLPDDFRGPIVEQGVTGMRSFVCEPMQHGRLYLAGDAAHIVPPTGAKGMNLALADVRVLCAALVRWYRDGDETGLAEYSDTCLRRVWRAEHFSWWMTSMLHKIEGGDPFDDKLQLSQLRYVTTSQAAATSLAENYVGLDWSAV
jgi:p-hydroxybenzoate 3-monooxygenase